MTIDYPIRNWLTRVERKETQESLSSSAQSGQKSTVRRVLLKKYPVSAYDTSRHLLAREAR